MKTAEGEPEEGKMSMLVGTIPNASMNITMASLSSMTMGVDQLQSKFLRCHNCSKPYNSDDQHPRLLPCLHTLCYKCVKEKVENKKIVCPKCNVEHKSTSSDMREFPRDDTREDLMDFVRVQNDTSGVTCQSCGEDSPATHRCQECGEFLCSKCKEAHKRLSVTRSHELISMENLKKEKTLGAFSHPQKCPQHREKFNLYCSKVECQKPVCYVCVLCDHKETDGHKINNTDEISNNKKQDISKEMDSLKKAEERVTSVIRDVDLETTAVGEKGRDVEMQIDAAFDGYIKILEKRREELKNKVASHVDRKTKVLDTQMSTLTAHRNQIEEAIYFSDQALAYTNSSALLQIEKTIIRRMRSLNQQPFDKMPHETAALGFSHKGLHAEIQKDIIGMASVWASSIYPPNTRIEQEGDAIENEIVTFFVFTANFQGQKSDDRVGVISARVKGPKGVENMARVDERLSGSEDRFRISFVPFESGEHVLEIRIVDRPIGTYRFQVIANTDVSVSNIPTVILQKAKLPEFSFDRARAHRDVTVSPDGKTFLNSAAAAEPAGPNTLQKYKGAMSTVPIQAPGSHYYELNVRYKIRRPLEKCNLVFEIGLARGVVIDNRHHVEGQTFAWSLIGAHHNDCDKICLHIAHGNQCIFHDSLSKNEAGATMSRNFGFMVDTDKQEWKIFDSAKGEQICVIDAVDGSEPLYPVVAGYNPFQVEVTMNLRTGSAINQE
ncbi:tripartite motif-containing protein 45-like isoform X2 [Mizuhopecten yessoensis]|uniref:tripartite motif-containing protein 45-like isoform X2 n=1 Tax=Mizuhopecten yessoensis TaxID=6573 RepID=UPI000B458093|nr:tripartite motif-containing protein 45-like isoform X2 [Mizuhopecten yessoensis]